MKVSVVVPAFNEGTFIGACLDSLMKQEVPPDEIIVVNNNSTDNTVKIAKKYPVKIVNEKKQGMISARNRGFDEVSYEIIARTDADTTVPPDWIKKIKKNFEDEKLIALSGPSYFYDISDYTQSSDWSAKAAFEVEMSYMRLLKKILKHYCLYGPNMALRKTAWEKVRNDVCLDDSQVHEDIDLGIHLAPLGKIKFDRSLIVNASFRRWKKPEPYIEYTYRVFKSIQRHKQSFGRSNSALLFKKIASKGFVKSLLRDTQFQRQVLNKIKD